jgi:glyoxylase-like metal-dependent hydrolase (beta-lactamase superfamily II)
MKKSFLPLIAIIITNSIVVTAQENGNIYPYKSQAFEIALLSDAQGKGNKSILIDATPEMLREHAPDGAFLNGMNAFLVKIQGKNILIDTGLGTKLFDNLSSVGIAPEQIEVILITHMHGDHIGGLLRNEHIAFPKATVYINQREYDYWRKSTNRLAQSVLTAYKDKIKLFNLDSESGNPQENLFPGIQAMAAYGHTPGHTMYLLGSDKDCLLVWGDLTHAMAIQMPYPQVAVTYDIDPVQAVASRVATLEYVAEHNILVAGMHMAYPAIGRVGANGKTGYRFTAITER